MKLTVWLSLLLIEGVFAIGIDYGLKIKFISSFITSNPSKFELYLPDWSHRQKQILLKQTHGTSLRLSSLGSPSKNSIRIYDFTTSKKALVRGIPKNSIPKVFLLDDTAQLDTMLREVDLLPGRNVITARFAMGNTLVKISRCYRLLEHTESSIILEYLFSWSLNDWNKTDSLDLFKMPRKRINFNGIPLNVAIVLNDVKSLDRLEDFRDVWTDTYTKANYGAISKMLQYFNITPIFKVFQDYEHMRKDDKYIISVTAPHMTTDLLANVEFLKVAPRTKLCFTLRRPPTSFVTTIFTVNFTPSVWYAMLGLLGLLSGALYIFLNVEAHQRAIKGKTSFNVYDLLLIGLEAVCQQGTSTDPRSYAARTLQLFMFMAFMFLYVAYSANILVLLQSTTAMTSASQLSEYGIEFGGLNTSDFNYYPPKTADRLFRQDIKAPHVYTLNDGMTRVREGIFAFFSEARYSDMYARQYYKDYEVCGLQEFEFRYDYGLGYAALPKGSGYSELFKTALLEIFEKGFTNRHYLRYFPKLRCYSQGSSFDPIGIREIYQAIILVGIGVAFGVLVFGLEVLLSHYIPASSAH